MGDGHPGSDHPLISLPNALCTPHIGYVERDNYERYFGIAFDNLNAFAEGRPQNIVNPEALGPLAQTGTER
jgi:D-3-phosphoglycerate dehydrogenase